MTAARVSLAAVILLGVTILGLQPAGAGGSTWDITPDPATPGDLIHAEAVVAWAHSDRLGTPDDGPWRAWIRPVGNGNDLQGGFADVPDDAIPVGDITVSDDGGFGTATIDFTLPQVPAGDYEFIHCNEPCTTTLGDITWGLFTITTTTSAQTPLTTTTTTEPAPGDGLPVTSTSVLTSHIAATPNTSTGGAATTAGFGRNAAVGVGIVALLLAVLHFLLPRKRRADK